jgi:hypothetical protein
VPAELYRDGLPERAHAEYDELLGLAAEIYKMAFRESSSESHMAASEFMIDHADQLYAIWDGQPARAYGGTADVVAYARQRGVPVRVIWPEGSERD